MHQSVMDYLRRVIAPADVAGRRVLEVGAQDVNGSPRAVIGPLGPAEYLGVDYTPGRGVDRVLDATRLTAEVGVGWDLVVSTEMLEHAEDWRHVVWEMKRAVAPGGLLIVTARGPGFPYHGWPYDFWRFTPADFEAAFADLADLVVEPDPGRGFPGVFARGRRVAGPQTVDLCAIQPAPAPAPSAGRRRHARHP